MKKQRMYTCELPLAETNTGLDKFREPISYLFPTVPGWSPMIILGQLSAKPETC